VNCKKTTEPIEMPFWVMDSNLPKEICIIWGPDLPREGAIIRGKNMPGHAQRQSVVSCAKMAEPIDLPFGLWTRVGQRKHGFNRFCRVAQYALVGGHIGATLRTRLNRPSAVCRSRFQQNQRSSVSDISHTEGDKIWDTGIAEIGELWPGKLGHKNSTQDVRNV